MDSFDKLDRLGEILIKNFKDFPLSCLNSLFEGKSLLGEGQGLYEAVRNLDEESKDLMRACLTEAAVLSICAFLTDLEYFDVTTKDASVLAFGENICEIADGPLGGYVRGDEYCWDEKYSKYPPLNAVYASYPDPAKNKK